MMMYIQLRLIAGAGAPQVFKLTAGQGGLQRLPFTRRLWDMRGAISWSHVDYKLGVKHRICGPDVALTSQGPQMHIISGKSMYQNCELEEPTLPELFAACIVFLSFSLSFKVTR